MTLHFMNDVANDVESIQNRKLRRSVKKMGDLINRIQCTRFASFDIKFTRPKFKNACLIAW